MHAHLARERVVPAVGQLVQGLAVEAREARGGGDTLDLQAGLEGGVAPIIQLGGGLEADDRRRRIAGEGPHPLEGTEGRAPRAVAVHQQVVRQSRIMQEPILKWT